MKTYGGGGGVYVWRHYYWPRQEIEVCGQIHVQAALILG
jgi:hypothetical protein